VKGWLLANLFLMFIVLTGAAMTTMAARVASFFWYSDDWTTRMAWALAALVAAVATYYVSAALHKDLQSWLSR
jgi:hypothetical protein